MKENVNLNNTHRSMKFTEQVTPAANSWRNSTTPSGRKTPAESLPAFENDEAKVWFPNVMSVLLLLCFSSVFSHSTSAEIICISLSWHFSYLQSCMALRQKGVVVGLTLPFPRQISFISFSFILYISFVLAKQLKRCKINNK